jgi:uncharacterized iron-regulated membrane protein
VELVQRGLQVLIALLVVALAVLLLVFVACMAYLARSVCRCRSKNCSFLAEGGILFLVTSAHTVCLL